MHIHICGEWGRGDVEHEDICYVIVTPLSYFQYNCQGISEP